MRVFAPVICLTGLVLALPANAAVAKRDCDSNQTAMTECAAQDYTDADAELNQTYQALMKKFDGRGGFPVTFAKVRQGLIDAERAWIGYRDKECVFESLATEGGSVQPMMTNLCLASFTRARTKELMGQLNCDEGVLNCVSRISN